MKLPSALAIVAALGVANVACVQAQRTEPSSQTDPNGQKSAAGTVPSVTSSVQQRDTVGFPSGSDGTAGNLDTKWVSALVGMKVETPSGARLGTVKDVIVDGYGRQTYAIISYAGMMGLGNKYTAVPWATVAEMLQRDRLLMDQGQLESAPLLSSAKPDSANKGWRGEADNYWRGKVAVGAGSANVPPEPNSRAPASQSQTPPTERR
jgi:sporulation protein YlmC with PRC-barrel domain